MRGRRTLISVSSLVASLILAPAAVEAQAAAPAIDIAGAWVGFPDDGTVSEALVGGAARWHLRPRLSIGPEVVYIQGDNHSHLVLTGNLTFEFRPEQSVQPFLVVGGGMYQPTKNSLMTRSRPGKGRLPPAAASVDESRTA